MEPDLGIRHICGPTDMVGLRTHDVTAALGATVGPSQQFPGAAFGRGLWTE